MSEQKPPRSIPPYPETKKEPTLYSNILSGVFKSQKAIEETITSTKDTFSHCKETLLSAKQNITNKMYGTSSDKEKKPMNAGEKLNLLEKYSSCVEKNGEKHASCIDLENQIKYMFENEF